MTNTMALIAICTICAAIVCLILGMRAGLFVGFLVSVLILPTTLWVSGYDARHVGITTGYFEITTYTAVLAVFAAYMLLMRTPPIGPLALTLAMYLIAALVLWWGVSPEIVSGIVLFISAGVAFGLGRYIFATELTEVHLGKTLISIIVVVLALEAAVCLLQAAGVELNILSHYSVSDITAATTEGRVNGTADHPGTLGKLIYLALMIILPFTIDSERYTRVMACTGLALGGISLILTQSRANVIGAMILVGLWLIVNYRGKRNRRVILSLSIGLIVATAFAYGPILKRFEDANKLNGGFDPRTHLMEIALKNLPQYFLTGTGPNAYVATIGRTDRLTALGWPVHNSAMLLLLELGAVGVAIAATAFLVVTRRMILEIRNGGHGSRFAKSFMCALPGLVLIGWTGWGLLSGSVLLFLCFTTGALLGACSYTSVFHNTCSAILPGRTEDRDEPVPSARLSSDERTMVRQ